MVCCAAYRCPSRSDRRSGKDSQGPKVSFHRFPKNKELREKWIRAVGRDFWEPSDKSTLCSIHFTEECFDRNSNITRLRQNAVPTIFTTYPSYLQKIYPKERRKRIWQHISDPLSIPEFSEQPVPSPLNESKEQIKDFFEEVSVILPKDAFTKLSADSPERKPSIPEFSEETISSPSSETGLQSNQSFEEILLIVPNHEFKESAAVSPEREPSIFEYFEESISSPSSEEVSLSSSKQSFAKSCSVSPKKEPSTPEFSEEPVPSTLREICLPRQSCDKSTSVSPDRLQSCECPAVTEIREKIFTYKIAEYRKKVKSLHQTKRRYLKKIDTMRDVIRCLTDRNKLLEQNGTVLNNLPSPSKEILKRSPEKFLKIQFRPMSRPRLLLLSSSNVEGYGFLEYAASDITNFLNTNNVSTVLFVPYAAIDHDEYLRKVSPVFEKWGFQVEGIHKTNPVDAVKKAEAIFVGGGNTFLLLKTLYDNKLIEAIQNRVVKDGVPYIGSSAGTNVAAPTIHNTNDMPIVYPPSFNALNLIPFNINPHYLDPDVNSKHKGETREERILQYHQLPAQYPVYNVLGLREGCTLYVNGTTAVLKGINKARLFLRGKPPQEIESGTDISFLLPKNEGLQPVR